MHIPKKLREQIEVDWTDPAHIIDPDTGEITNAWLFVGILTYSQYAFVMAFINEKTRNWIKANNRMFDFFGGVTPVLVSDNCTTAVNHSKSNWYTTELNTTYHEMAKHYNLAIIPARVRKPKDKPNADGSVSNISTWITAALRNEQFFSLAELNTSIREKLRAYNVNLLIDLLTARENRTFLKVLSKYTKPTLLILDEWLLLKLIEKEARDLFELIHKHRKRASTIFCSQFREAEWYERLCENATFLADAIMDRILYDAYKINIESIEPKKDISMREVYGLAPSMAT